jgi:hypothetical protein
MEKTSRVNGVGVLLESRGQLLRLDNLQKYIGVYFPQACLKGGPRRITSFRSARRHITRHTNTHTHPQQPAVSFLVEIWVIRDSNCDERAMDCGAICDDDGRAD